MPRNSDTWIPENIGHSPTLQAGGAVVLENEALR